MAGLTEEAFKAMVLDVIVPFVKDTVKKEVARHASLIRHELNKEFSKLYIEENVTEAN